MILILLLVCFFFFLFALYVFMHDDFMMLRKNISMEQIFNIAFLTAGVALFAARLFYVLFNFSTDFLNPLVFFLFWYFPGLSLPAGIGAAVIFLTYYCMKKKIPLARLLDFFSLSVLAILPFGITGSLLLQGDYARAVFIVPVLFLGIFFLFSTVLLAKQRRGDIKDGTLTLLFLLVFAGLMVVQEVLEERQMFHITDTILSLSIIVAALILFVRNERLLSRLFSLRKRR